MALWPFNRNRDEQSSNVASEVKQYYQSERRERVGLAWLLAAATLVVTVLVVLGLFYGGRWVYRSINNSDDTETTAASQERDSDTSSSIDEERPSSTNNQSNSQTQTPSPSANPNPTPAPSSPNPTIPNTGAEDNL